METPEFVYGIPTKKSQSKERVGLIRDYYPSLSEATVGNPVGAYINMLKELMEE